MGANDLDNARLLSASAELYEVLRDIVARAPMNLCLDHLMRAHAALDKVSGRNRP